jgi:hypothetical protein
MTNTAPINEVFKAFWRGIAPDPLPPIPEALPADPRDAWEVGARAGIRQGRRLACAEHEAGLPLVAPMPEVEQEVGHG